MHISQDFSKCPTTRMNTDCLFKQSLPSWALALIKIEITRRDIHCNELLAILHLKVPKVIALIILNYQDGCQDWAGLRTQDVGLDHGHHQPTNTVLPEGLSCWLLVRMSLWSSRGCMACRTDHSRLQTLSGRVDSLNCKKLRLDFDLDFGDSCCHCEDHYREVEWYGFRCDCKRSFTAAEFEQEMKKAWVFEPRLCLLRHKGYHLGIPLLLACANYNRIPFDRSLYPLCDCSLLDLTRRFRLKVRKMALDRQSSCSKHSYRSRQIDLCLEEEGL